MAKKLEQIEKEKQDWGLLGSLKKNIEGNNEKETRKIKVLRNSADKQKSLESNVTYTQAKRKLNRFMSIDTSTESEDTVLYGNQENGENLLNGYHFETVNRWINIKPQPEMVVGEVRILNDNFQEIIDSYLKSNPAKIKELQIKLNDLINYWMVINDKNSPTGRRTIRPIDVEILKRVLQWTGMELIDNWEASKRRYTIREDWMLWPQTFAVLCCFKKEYRNSSTTNTNRGTIQR